MAFAKVMDNCGGTQSSKGRHAPYGCQMKQLLPTQKLQIPDHQIREFRPLQVIKFIGSFARRARSRAANSRNLRASNDYAWQLKDLKMSSPLKHAGLGVRNYKQTGPFWSTVDKIWRLSALSLFGATLAAGGYFTLNAYGILAGSRAAQKELEAQKKPAEESEKQGS